MSEQAAAYVTTNWTANCGHAVCSETAVYWHGLHPDTQGGLCPACAGEYLTRLYREEANATLEASAYAGESFDDHVRWGETMMRKGASHETASLRRGD